MFKIHRGRDAFFNVTVRRGRQPLDISNINISCSVKNASGQLLFNAVVQKTDPTRGKLVVKFPASQTASLTAGSKIYFDLKFEWSDGTVRNYPSTPLEVTVIEPVT